jgi:hypothetical protein
MQYALYSTAVVLHDAVADTVQGHCSAVRCCDSLNSRLTVPAVLGPLNTAVHTPAWHCKAPSSM